MPELPSLQIEQLIDTDELITFSHREGVIVYNQADDDWKLYKVVENYEEKGKIIKIQKLDSIIIVSLEKGGLIISKDQIFSVESVLLSSFSLGENLIALSCKNDKRFKRDDWDQYNVVDQILLFNSKTVEIDTISLNKSFYRIQSCTFHNDTFWVSVIDDRDDEYWSRSFLEIDLSGNVVESNLVEKLGQVRMVFTYEDNLYIIGDSCLFIRNENKTVSKIADIGNCTNYDIVNKSNLLYFILNNHPDDGSREMEYLKLNLKDYSFEKVLFNCDANSLNYSEYNIQHNALLCKNEYMDRVDKIDTEAPHTIYKYSIRDGITSYIEKMVEDENDIWFLTSYNGLSRFSKIDSSWKNYCINTDLRLDSTHFLSYHEITFNEDYLFVPLRDNNGTYIKYLTFNKFTETFQLFTKDEFISKFFFDEGRFVDYKGHAFFAPQYSDTMLSMFNYIPEWSALLFLYDLPAYGCNTWNSRSKIISNQYSAILSISVLDPPKYWFKGLIVKFKDVNSLKIISYPQQIRNFNASGVPYMIAGDDEMIFAAGYSGDGIFTYRILEEILESNKDWFHTLQDIVALKNTKNHIIVGNARGIVFAFEKAAHKIIDLSNFISGTPLTSESTEHYIYIGTDKGLVYFDNELNYLGKLFKSQAKLYKTDFNLYFQTGNNIYQIIEK
ncbi:MAG: hypothetical protein KKF98_12175 [Bacteroidetes bacterium]|nr:hypothetical protein [Bacteroidota bacterium]